MSAPTYRLVTIADILQIPPDRRTACFKDLELALLTHELAFGDVAPDVVCKAWVWTDDGERHITLQANGEKLLELTVTKGQTP